MRNWKSLLLKAIAGLFALLALLVLVLMAVNRQDQPISESARKLRLIADAGEPVADRDNAYVYAMGFSAPDNDDAMSAGASRIEWLRTFMAKSEFLDFPKMPGEERRLAESREAQLKQIAIICKDRNRDCAELLQNHSARLPDWVHDNASLIERYEHMLELKQWREMWPSDVRAPVAPFSHVFEAQRLMFLQTLALAEKGDAAACKRILEKDLRFWRMVLAESSSLIVKMLAARGIEQHFGMGNLVLRRLSPGLVVAAIPGEWQAPISHSERSMARVVANEWVFSDTYMGLAAKNGNLQRDGAQGEDLVGKLFASILFQPQATSNANADRMLAIVALFDRDYAVIPAAEGALMASRGFAEKDFTGIGLYNPVGQFLLNLGGMEVYSKYGYRIANLEGIRRVSLLASQLRSSGAKRGDAAEGARKSDLRDPYDATAFIWDSAQNSLVFHRTLEGKPDFRLVY